MTTPCQPTRTRIKRRISLLQWVALASALLLVTGQLVFFIFFVARPVPLLQQGPEADIEESPEIRGDVENNGSRAAMSPGEKPGGEPEDEPRIEEDAAGPQPESEPAEKITAETVGVRRPPESPRQIRLTAVDQRKPAATDAFAEIRLLNARLQNDRPESPPGSNVLVRVAFFEQDQSSAEIRPARGFSPPSPLRLDGDWQPGETREVAFSYIMPRHGNGEAAESGPEPDYYGYIIRVFLENLMQDQHIYPDDLPAKLRAAGYREQAE